MATFGWRRFVFLVLFFVGAKDISNATTDPSWTFGIMAGSAECTCKAPRWSHLAQIPAVQKLVLELAAKPMITSEMDAKLRASGTSKEELDELGFVRREGDKYILNFALFTTADEEKMYAVSERYARSLANEILLRRHEIEAAAAPYSAPGVDRKSVLFIVVGYFSLTLDGMELTGIKGYRTTHEQHLDGAYVPLGLENRSVAREKGFTVASSKTLGNVTMMWFGDDSHSRQAFPDLLGDLFNVLNVSTSVPLAAHQLGEIMFCLRDHAATTEDLARAASISPIEAEKWVNWLLTVGYVAPQQNHYVLAIPVFSGRDRWMINAVRRICAEVLSKWVASNFSSLSIELRETTPSRWGVPVGQQLNLIWPILFGLTVRNLAASGLVVNPYAEGRLHRGYVPAIYTQDVAEAHPQGNFRLLGSVLIAFALAMLFCLWWRRSDNFATRESANEIPTLNTK